MPQQRSLTSFFAPKDTTKTASTPPKSSDMPKSRSSPKTPASGSKRANEDPQGNTSSTEANDASKRLKVDNCDPRNGGKPEGGMCGVGASFPFEGYQTGLCTFLTHEMRPEKARMPAKDTYFSHVWTHKVLLAFEPSCHADTLLVLGPGKFW